jgi:hypothetical protein
VIEPRYGVAIVDFARNRFAGFIRIRDAASFALTPSGRGQLESSLPVGLWDGEAAISADGQVLYLLGTSPVVLRFRAATGAQLASLLAGAAT